MWKHTNSPRVFELPVPTSPRWLGLGHNDMFHPSTINHRIVKHFSSVALQAGVFAIFECKSVPALFVPSSVIHRNAVPPCISNCASPIHLRSQPFRIHIGSRSRVGHGSSFLVLTLLFRIRSWGISGTKERRFQGVRLMMNFFESRQQMVGAFGFSCSLRFVFFFGPQSS